MVACIDLTLWMSDPFVRVHAYHALQAQRRPKHWLVGRPAKVPHAQDVHQYLRRCRVRPDSALPHYYLLHATNQSLQFLFLVRFVRFVRFQFEIERLMIIERLKRRAWLVVVVCRNGGAFAVVPGTHRLPHGPWETLGRSFRSTMTLDAELDELQMPNWFKFGARDSFFLVSCSVDFSFAGRLLTRVHVVWSV